MTERTAETVEQALRDELARGDELIAAARPILRHLLANCDRGLFSEERIARVRGMMLDVAKQLLFVEAEAADARDPAGYVAARQEPLAEALCDDGAILVHAQALTIEAQLAEQVQARSGIDSVLPPLVEDLAAGPDAVMAGLAMAVLAAQARFLQRSRRMELPLGELPGDLFHRALLILRAKGGEAAETAEHDLRGSYNEGTGRLSLVTRLVMGLGENAASALSIDHAGPAIFTTALAMASGQERDLAVLSFAGRRSARFMLGLRAAGLEPQAAAGQVLIIDPRAVPPEGFELLTAERAAALLAAARPVD